MLNVQGYDATLVPAYDSISIYMQLTFFIGLVRSSTFKNLVDALFSRQDREVDDLNTYTV